MTHYISLGGGIQSTALTLMNLHGEITPAAQGAIFADTGWERRGTYEAVRWLTSYCATYNFPVFTVAKGNLREKVMERADSFIKIPTHTLNKKGQRVMLSRQCTGDYKIAPVRKFIRERGATAKNPFTVWLGISVDEVGRMRPSNVRYLNNRFPLIEKRLNRHDCARWLQTNGYPVPVRSACIGCPYASNPTWQQLTPAELEDAIEVDEAIRSRSDKYDHDRYLHFSQRPLKEKPFRVEGQLTLFDLETEECSGGCFL